MYICEFCGKTVNRLNAADACNACAASMNFKPVIKSEPVKSLEDKDNQDFMLAYFDISLAQFEAVNHDNLSDIIDSEFANWYKNDAKRVLWHEYRANAFTKKGTMRKLVEKRIQANLNSPVLETKTELIKEDVTMNNTNEVIENAGFEWVDGLYIKITGLIFETLTDKAGADRLIMSKGIYDALYAQAQDEMYIPATEESVKDHLIKTGGISQIRFIHFIYNKKWYAITAKEAIKHRIKEDSFEYEAFAYEKDYDDYSVSSEALMNAYDFNLHNELVKESIYNTHNRKIERLLAS